ncbi:MAG TPA: chlorosome envelope protein B, partial [Prosthecochloris aestuarii]|nr:chlorosome envelope protein B [Prosthecochloris aestuarii]
QAQIEILNNTLKTMTDMVEPMGKTATDLVGTLANTMNDVLKNVSSAISGGNK